MKKTILFAACIAFAMNASAAVPTNVPTSGLKGYWPFEGNANDASVNGNNGTVSGATSTTDRYGNSGFAYNFNGTSDYISVPSATTLSNYAGLTISLWAKPTTIYGTIPQAMVAKWFLALNCGSSSDTYETAIVNGELNFATNLNNSGLASTPNLTAADNGVWRHFVFVYNNSASTLGVYIDGSLIHSESVSGSGICSSINTLFFGADWNRFSGTTYRFFGGALDDIGIWNRPLTDCEILGLYAPEARAYQARPATSTGINESNMFQNTAVVSQNSPNPFKNETVISYSLPQNIKAATLEVYDMIGAKVRSLTLTEKGEASVIFNSENLPAGVYMYSIITDDKKTISSKKMVIAEK